MSVMVVNDDSIKTITMFLIQAFDPDPVGEFSQRHFRPYNSFEEYPVLSDLMKSLRVGKNQHELPRSLYYWNNLSYLKRYPQEKDDLDITPFGKYISIPRKWHYDYYKMPRAQVYTNLQCYLYQIEDETKLMKELKRLLIAYGNHLFRQTTEYENTKWE